MKNKITIVLLFVVSFFMACDNEKEEVDLIENEEINLEVIIPEMELKRGVIPISIKVFGTDSTSIMLDGVKIFESTQAEYEFNLDTEEYNDGVYSLSVIPGNSEETKFEQEIEIFNKLMTYELLGEELDRTDQDNRWRIIVLTTLDGDFLDYKIMESAGIYDFEKPDGFEGEEFMLYFFWKRTLFGRTNLVGNAFDIKIGKWGTSPMSTEIFPNPETREQTIQLADFEQNDNNTLSFASRENGMFQSISGSYLNTNLEFTIANFPYESNIIDVFHYDRNNNNDDLSHLEIKNEEVNPSTSLEISSNNFIRIEPSFIPRLPENVGFTYSANVFNNNRYAEVFDFRETNSREFLYVYDLGVWYENYEHSLSVTLNDEFKSVLEYKFRNENVPVPLPEINFNIVDLQAKSNEVSFTASGDEGLINISFLNRIDNNTNLRVFVNKNYKEFINVKLPDLPKEIIEFEPLFAQYNENTSAYVEINNEPVKNSAFKVFLGLHGRTNERNLEFLDTRSLGIPAPIN